MPRPKVDERFRKRISKACLHCQKTKQKCDGLMPCRKCVRRNQTSSCVYSTHERSYGRRRNRRNRIDSRDAQRIEPNTSASPPSYPTEPNGRPTNVYGANGTVKEPEVAVPGLSQVLYDNKGRIVYLGNCAALAFLQNIQQLIENETGYAADVSNLSVVEELPPIQDGSLDPYTTRNIDELKNLIDVFFVSTCGIIDLFDRRHVETLLVSWTSQDTLKSGSIAVLYLVIACAAQIRSASLIDKLRAQSFYQHGRQLALLELTNDPTIETIQAFTLISIYMLGCSWRNGASLNLGIAISAAKSLGYHQDDTNSVYDREERHRRAQVWKTLHYHDLFFSAMMGRSSSTSNSDLNIVDYEHSAQDGFDDEFDRSLSMCESLRAFLVIERAVNKVYTKKTVSLGILQSLTCELQVKSINLPQSLRMPAASDTLHGFRRTQEVNLRNAHVACSYYFAMMLLTRPFLITTLRAKSSTAPSQSTQGLSNQVDGNISSEIASGARTCIDSATYTVQLLHELLDASMLFKNMPFVVAWTFVSVLVLNSAYFGQLDLQRPIARTLRQAEDILQYFTVDSPQARRYQLILKKLSRAAEDHWNHVEQRTLHFRSAYIPRLFQLHSDNHDHTFVLDRNSHDIARDEEASQVTRGTQNISTCSAIHETNCLESRPSLAQPMPVTSELVNHDPVPQNFPMSDSGTAHHRSELIPDEVPAFGPWFQLDDYSSIWDFSWAGSL